MARELRSFGPAAQQCSALSLTFTPRARACKCIKCNWRTREPFHWLLYVFCLQFFFFFTSSLGSLAFFARGYMLCYALAAGVPRRVRNSVVRAARGASRCAVLYSVCNFVDSADFLCAPVLPSFVAGILGPSSRSSRWGASCRFRASSSSVTCAPRCLQFESLADVQREVFREFREIFADCQWFNADWWCWVLFTPNRH